MPHSIKVFDAKDFPSYLPKLNSLYDDLFEGGKGFRAKLVARIASTIGLNNSTERLLAQTIEFIHNASLLHDDLIDRSVLRRGKPAAWTKYTPEYAVLAGDYLLARVMVNLSHFGNVQLIQFTAQMISDLLEGEWIQDSLVGDFSLAVTDLDRVHDLKTGSLFKWCLKAPFIARGDDPRSQHLSYLTEAGALLGQLFQRGDDLLDFDIRNDENKAVLGDLRSGYLNSFAAFALADLNAERRSRAIESKSLGEFKMALGESDFNQAVARFDAVNTGIIDRYTHLIRSAEQLQVPGIDTELADFLQQLPTLLYWRKQK